MQGRKRFRTACGGALAVCAAPSVAALFAAQPVKQERKIARGSVRSAASEAESTWHPTRVCKTCCGVLRGVHAHPVPTSAVGGGRAKARRRARSGAGTLACAMGLSRSHCRNGAATSALVEAATQPPRYTSWKRAAASAPTCSSASATSAWSGSVSPVFRTPHTALWACEKPLSWLSGLCFGRLLAPAKRSSERSPLSRHCSTHPKGLPSPMSRRTDPTP
mmetsp:Transcript_63513/g.141642  ORF Transcript_63513/g.141642 Transcript_63513/m.141642 type:complete len:220 (+) Transcript_63513:3042-3701(+)